MTYRKISIATIAFFLSVTPAVAVSNVQDIRRESAASRAAVREAGKQRWEELKANRQAKREEVKATIQTKREEVKANIQKMRDTRKKQVVDRVQERLNSVNERRTEHFLNVLDRLLTVLDKIASRTEKAKAEGKDVASIETAVASARTAISSAESAVNTQKARVYQIAVTDDASAKGEVDAAVKQMHADLQATQDTVAAAREAVHNVYQQIKALVGQGTATP